MMKKSIVAALAASALLAAPAYAAGGQAPTAIAPEAMYDAEQAPENYDVNAKLAANEKFKEKKNKSEGTVGILANPIIVLDPGHGGTDPGAVGNGIEEADVVLDIATRSKNYMAANYPATIYMTRTADTTLSLSQRTTFANSKYANFFVSYHINSYSTTSPNGLEVYHYPGVSDGQSLATNIYNKLKASYSTLRGVKTAEFYVLKYTNMAAALGETGFISNYTDATNLKSSTFKQNLATQYAQGMHVYWWGY